MREIKRRIHCRLGAKIEISRHQTGKSRCDAVYKESKRYDYLVQRILSAIGENDKHRIAKVSSIPISWGQFHF